MEDTVKKYLSILLEGATSNLMQMDEYIANTQSQLEEITSKRAEITNDIKELEDLIGDPAADEEAEASDEK